MMWGPFGVCHEVGSAFVVTPVACERFWACQSRLGRHQKRKSASSAPLAARISDISPFSVRWYALLTSATEIPVIAVTSTTCQYVAAVHQYTNNSLLAPRTSTCSTSTGTQETALPAALPPAICDTLIACQSCAGDHQNTDSVPSGDAAPTCSTRSGPLCASHAVGS